MKPPISKFNLSKVSSHFNMNTDVYLATDVEKLFEGAVKVYGHFRNGETIYAQSGYAGDPTHRAILLNVEPIKRTLEILVDETMPPDEFHMISAGKRYRFKFDGELK